ncbi:MAG: hypothetical protein HY735_36410 [Verrucomicrobia bacterium]|nr:hypothetical protein [Verrucomicrobiota bacterium]
MRVLPVIYREMLTESRRPSHYSLRLLAAALLICLLAFYGLARTGVSTAVGATVFLALSYSIYLGIWLAAPFLTADCLSREKREGTLGLLFLTPLTALEIVVGKSVVHGLRALSVLLAAAPIIAVPYLMGGVSWSGVLSVLAVELSALALALGAGLLGSVATRERRWALLHTGIWTLLFWNLHFGAAGTPFAWGTATRTGQLLAVSAFVLILIVLLAAWRIRSEWQDKPLSKRQLWWIRTFCSPLFWRDLFRASMRRKLDQNPITWLQYYSTWDRVAKLVWCGLALMFDTALISRIFQSPTALLGMELLFAAAMAYAAAASFRRERRNGAFELILVSPMPREDIISGRLRAVREQFFPAALTLSLPWLLFASMLGNRQIETVALFQCAFIWTSYWSLPVVGLYFALGKGGFFKALLNTYLIGCVVPMLLTQTDLLLSARRVSFENGFGMALGYQVLLIMMLFPILPQQFSRLAALPSRP